ncbi:MAG: ATP-binding protein, partial [Geothrix sp.]|nr:ATP-binding protein [Geothrix sp.]
EVEDSGAGMAPEVLHQAMLPFYTTKHWSGNRGLGLSLVHQTVESHRGTIDLQSEPGRGTFVHLRFSASGPVPADQAKGALQEPCRDDREKFPGR